MAEDRWQMAEDRWQKMKFFLSALSGLLIYKNDKAQRHPYWTFDVERSMFDVHQFLYRLDRPFLGPAARLTPEH